MDEFGVPPTGVQQGGNGKLKKKGINGIYSGGGLPENPGNPFYYVESDVWPVDSGKSREDYDGRLVFGARGEVYFSKHYNDNGGKFVQIGNGYPECWSEGDGMSYLKVLAATPWVGGGRPYLVNQSNQARLGELLANLGFGVSSVRVTEGAPVAELLDDIGKRLGWPHPTGGNWWGFQDYCANITDEGRGPCAIMVENSDTLLQVSPRRFVTVVHKLLSITEEFGPWSNTELPLEFFFLGGWNAGE